MEHSATRMLWWGIGLFGLAVVAFVVGATTTLHTALSSDPLGQSTTYWIVSPVVTIIQAAGFPLGAALIAASVVIRHINRWVAPAANDGRQTDLSHHV